MVCIRGRSHIMVCIRGEVTCNEAGMCSCVVLIFTII